jgi:hypothetical protein
VFEAANGSPPPVPAAAPPPRPAGLDVPLDLSLDDADTVRQPGAPARSQPVGAVELDAPAGGNGPAPSAAPPVEKAAPPPSPPSQPGRPKRARDSEPDDDRVRCPICRRANEPGARRCYHCGERLAGGARPRYPDRDDYDEDYGYRRRRDTEPHRGGTVLAMGIISLAGILVIWGVPIIFGIIGWVMGSTDLRKMRNNQMDPEGEGMTRAGWVCSIIGTLLNLLLILACGGFIGMMIWAESNNAPKTTRSWAPPPPVRATMPAKQPNWNPPIKDQVKDGK